MKKKNTQSEVLRKVLLKLRPQMGSIILSVILAVITVILTLEIPVLTGQAVDHIVSEGNVDFAGLFDVMLQITLVVAGTFVSQWIMNRINYRITYRVTKELREEAFAKMEHMPLSSIDSHSHGDYVSRIVTDADVVADGLLMGFTQLFTGIITIAGTMIFMLRISPWIALVVIVLTPMTLLVARFISTRTYKMFSLQAQIRGDQTGFVEEMIAGKKVLRALSYEETAQQKFNEMNGKLQDAAMKATFFSSLTNPATRVVNNIIYAGVGAAGALYAIAGGISVGQLTSFLGYATQYAKPFNEISGVITELQNAIACAGRLFEMIETPQEEERDENEIEEVKGKIELSHVTFGYDPEKPLIRDLSLTVEPGQRVAIVGPTGAGKTTLINLLMRFYEIQEGTISVDNVDITSMTRENLRKNIGMVLQETWLKEGTILDNLKVANPDATMEEITEAAKKSHAYDFIRKLPKGFDTPMATDGGSLSQGQKQLLCITRVMMNVPPILILDEATSSIDTRTEQKIQAAFSSMMEGRTSFVVAHRLSTIMGSDLILYMEQGTVKEMGTHEELLAKNGSYAKLYKSQYETVQSH